MTSASQERPDVRRRWPWVVAAAAVGVGILVLLPGVQARAKAVAAIGETLDLPVPRPLAPEIQREDTTFGGVPGHLYAPPGSAPGILLVPGATPAGLEDSRAIRVATALARAGRTVFMPELTLYERRFDEEDLDRLARAGRGLLDDERTRGRLQLVGFSYGGSFALVASADPRIRDELDQVAVFGAYFDMAGVVQAAATGVSIVNGELLEWDADPLAEQLLREQAIHLAPEEQQEELAAAFAGELPVTELPAEARALHELVTHDDPARTAHLVQALPPDIRARLERISPASVADRITAPVVALHSTDDPAVPYAEALRLEAGIDGVRLITVALFDHVDFQAADDVLGALPDLRRTWRFTSWVLGAQEEWLSVLR